MATTIKSAPRVEVPGSNGHHGTGGSAPQSTVSDLLNASDVFPPRHIGPGESEFSEMLAVLGHPSLDALSDAGCIVDDARCRSLAIDVDMERY